MDLILLEPGDQNVFCGQNAAWTEGGSLINPKATDDKTWSTSPFATGQCIELVSISQGMQQQITTDVSNSARTSGRPVVTEFTCVKYVDRTSVKFYEYCLRAKPLDSQDGTPTKLYILRNSGDIQAPILTFELRFALISEVQLQTHPDDMPTEQFKLNFAEIIWTFHNQCANVANPTGKLSAGWSLARNAPIGQFTK